MTEEQINIAIAESLGYKAVRASYGHWNLTHPAISIEVKGWFAREDAYRDAPKYTASLDACAEFEKTMTPEQGKTYVSLFDEVCGGELSLSDMADSPQEYLFWCVRATPPQKCEAYLRTIGKWTPSNQQPT